jgi:hypothetical protein
MCCLLLLLLWLLLPVLFAPGANGFVKATFDSTWRLRSKMLTQIKPFMIRYIESPLLTQSA